MDEPVDHRLDASLALSQLLVPSGQHDGEAVFHSRYERVDQADVGVRRGVRRLDDTQISCRSAKYSRMMSPTHLVTERMIGYPEMKPHDLRHGVAMEVLEQHHDLEQVRALLGHARIDTTQIYASIRPPQLKRAVSFYEEQATRMLADNNRTRTAI
ncbi:MAG: tyrosine-type recombinase/integrase [Vicinamibacterales bacterium]